MHFAGAKKLIRSPEQSRREAKFRNSHKDEAISVTMGEEFKKINETVMIMLQKLRNNTN